MDKRFKQTFHKLRNTWSLSHQALGNRKWQLK
jgi:hypothetical protein